MSRYEKRVLRLREHVLSHSNINAAKVNSSELDYSNLTKTEIGELLDEKNVDYNPRDTKRELYELLLGSD